MHYFVVSCLSQQFKPNRFQGEVSQTFSERPSFHRNLQKSNIDIPMFSFFLKRACMYALLHLFPFQLILNQI